MATATAPTTAPITAPASFPSSLPASILLPASLPAGLLEWQRREVVRSGELAIARGLFLVGRGTCRVAGHLGAPVFIVNSASRAGHTHLVWVERGRIHCDCEARTRGHAFTCAHAQFVRLLIVAEHAQPRSIPAAAVVGSVTSSVAAPAVEPEPEPEPEPPAPAVALPVPGPRFGYRGLSRVPRGVCPSCGAVVSLDELETLGKCIDCDWRAKQAPAVPAVPAVEPEPEPEPEPPTPGAGAGVRCPSCAGLTDAEEIAQLGECLNCLQMRADYARADRARAEWERAEYEAMEAERAEQLPCWCCGAPATCETSTGLYCDACVGKPARQKRSETRARQIQLVKEETARKIIAREKAREGAGIPSEASPRARRAPSRSRRAAVVAE